MPSVPEFQVGCKFENWWSRILFSVESPRKCAISFAVNSDSFSINFSRSSASRYNIIEHFHECTDFAVEKIHSLFLKLFLSSVEGAQIQP